ncbi:lanthionine synthetase C family protein [Kutzneria viridogrisea]|uniref:lanthionine synthetase C family protein n=1 Tax=Kutzneria viridogrisea TaxID=47990 RepID=UPI00338973B0
MTRPEPPPGWGQSLAAGAAGIALLHTELAHADTSHLPTAHRWTRAMTSEPVTANAQATGLFRGAPAVAFVLHAAARPGYASALSALDSHITTLVRHRLLRAHERIDRGELPALAEFDLISGLTGLGVYLLHRHGGGDLLTEVLAYLVRLTDPLHLDGQTLPGWWSGQPPADQPAHRFPGGHGNLGIAHGIAGPLALLATATRHGTTVAGQPEAIDRIRGWLEHWRCGTQARPWWPGRISLAESRAGTVGQAGPQRPSWCYGTPGLARAQQLAALALDDQRSARRAEQALAGCVADAQQLTQLVDSSLCHGWAGLVHTVWRTAGDATGDELAARLPTLRDRLSAHLHRPGPPAHDGLLEGTTGVRLVQHTRTGPPVTGWDAVLLLAG